MYGGGAFALLAFAFGLRLLFFLIRQRHRDDADQRRRELEEGRQRASRRDPALDDLIRESELRGLGPRKRDPKPSFGPIEDTVTRRCERCDMRLSSATKGNLCSPCQRVMKRKSPR